MKVLLEPGHASYTRTRMTVTFSFIYQSLSTYDRLCPMIGINGSTRHIAFHSYFSLSLSLSLSRLYNFYYRPRAEKRERKKSEAEARRVLVLSVTPPRALPLRRHPNWSRLEAQHTGIRSVPLYSFSFSDPGWSLSVPTLN